LFAPIEDEAILQDGVKGYRISVFEAKIEFPIIHMGPLNDEGSSSSIKIRSPQKVDDKGSNGEVAVQADVEQVDRREMLSHDADQDKREDEQVPEDCWHLNSNSNVGLNEEGPRVSLNGTINSQLVIPVKEAALKHIEYGVAIMKHGLSGVEVEERNILEVNRGLKVRSLVEANSEEGVRESPKLRSKAVQDFIGNCGCGSGLPYREDDVHRVQIGEKLENDVSLSSSSRSRTKTTQFSGNGYSEEMAKIYKNGLPTVDEEVNKFTSSSGGNSLDVLPGFNPLIEAQSGGGSVEANSYRKRNVTKQLHAQSNKRVTRSQTKQSKGSVSAT